MQTSNTIFIYLAGGAEPASAPCCYQVADHRLVIDRKINQLEPFRIESGEELQHFDSSQPLTIEEHHDNLVYDSDAWVGNAMRRIRNWFDGASYRIRIDGIGAFSITANGEQITLLELEEQADDAIMIEALLGPALILALAIDDVFCLHASAVKAADNIILFLGDSGAGKSTMARILQNDNLNIYRVTDDISPLDRQHDRFDLLPDFPQLKLQASQQCVKLNTPSAGIDAIYQLNRVPPGNSSPISRERLSALDAFKALVGQSVVSRLFPQQLLRRHTRQIAKLATAVPLYRLDYPSGLQHTASLQDFLIETCEYRHSEGA